MRKNQAMISEIAAIGFGISICLFGLVVPLLLGFVISVARLVFCMPNMWSGFRVSVTLSIAVFLMSFAPEMAFVTMAYGLAGAIMGQTAKQTLFPPHRLKSRFPRFSYSVLLFLMTGIFSVAQMVQYSFYGRMYQVSAGRLQEILFLDAFAKVKETYEQMGMWSSLGIDESLFGTVAKLFRTYMPTQIILFGLLMSIVCTFIFACVIPMAPVLRKMLRKNWNRMDIPLSWLIAFGVCMYLWVAFYHIPSITPVLMNVVAILISVFTMSGFASVSRWLSKYIPSTALRVLTIVFVLGAMSVYTSMTVALGILMIFVWIDSYRIYKDNKKKVS